MARTPAAEAAPTDRPPGPPAPAERYLAVLGRFRAAAADLRAAADEARSWAPGPGALAQANGMLLALAGRATYPGPADGWLARSAEGPAVQLGHLAAGLGDLLKTLPQALERVRRQAAEAGQADPAVPAFRAADFPRGLVRTEYPAGAVGALWSDVPAGHPARPFIPESDLADVDRVGRCVVLTQDPGRQGVYDLADVLRLTRLCRDFWDGLRADRRRAADLERQRAEGRRMGDPLERIKVLEDRLAGQEVART